MSSLAAKENCNQFTFVDRPKTYLKIVTLMIWGVACFLLYKALGEPVLSWPLPITSAFFVLCSCLVLREFLFRPTRVTTLNPDHSEIVIQETAPLRRRRVAASLSKASRFEVRQCDSENTASFEVRIQSNDRGWVIVAEYLSKNAAEHLADDANRILRAG